MSLLISNDDGVHAIGIRCLSKALAEVGHAVTVVAPDRDRSGASNSLTLDRPLHPIHLENGLISVNGTPTDCVHLGIHALSEEVPTRVISGINAGANLGDDVLYSGTVAAAMEGRFLKETPVAVSLAGKEHYATAAQVVVALLEKMNDWAFPSGTVLNINVPDLPFEDLLGWRFTQLGHRDIADQPIKAVNPRGKECYWISTVGKPAFADDTTDFHCIESGYVSITPLHVDMTHHPSLNALKQQFPDGGRW